MPTHLNGNLAGKIFAVPYRHAIIDNLLAPDVFARLCQTFDQILARGLSEDICPGRFSRFPGYDAYSYVLEPEAGFAQSLFYARGFKNFLSGLFGVATTDDVVVELHHHLTGSRSGFVHSDFNRVCFASAPLPNGLNPWHYQVPFDGAGCPPGSTIERCRAIAFLYFLNNPGWKPGDGGETGLYAAREPLGLRKVVAPLDNRLLAFEVSPSSFHGFISNRAAPRNAVVGWLHGELEHAAVRFPGHALEAFRASSSGG
jgi:2-oxoglutarate-Fe(II)-dependent oxygenase superfamily protein